MDANKEISDDIIVYIDKHRMHFKMKRGSDVILSIIALIILAPLLLVTAIAIKVDSKGKVIFTQLRTGQNGKVFKMYKFRSMCEDAQERHKDLIDQNEMDGPVFKISNDPRITKVGKLIRRYSIDELPQLFNVLRGEMSIVGPRPLAVYETEQFNDYENQRHLVKPGLTCFWQISGRNDLSFHDWMELDIKYLTKMNLFTDFLIILRTFKVVLLKKGAY